jgi:hypothetical protein
VDAFGVAADAFVVNRVSEMPKETFCEWRNVRAESVVNPSAFLAGPDKASVAQKSQVSGKVDCVVSRASHTKLVVTQRRNHPQACRVCQCLGKCDGSDDLVKRMFLLGLIAVISARCRNSRSERRVPQISVSHFVPIAYTAPRCVI